MRRRDFLGGALAALTSRRAFAMGEEAELDIGEIQLSSGTLSRPQAWTRLLFEMVQTTAVETNPRVIQLEPDDPALFRHPFAVLVGDGALPLLSDAAASQLGRYLAYGGFLFIDDASGVSDSPFDASVRQLIARVFPTRPLAVLPTDHSVYRSFFLLRQPMGRVAIHRVLEGVAQGSMNPLMYGRDDLSGALDRDVAGRDLNPCTPGGEDQRSEAMKLAINLMMYALTSNYKHDQAHVKQLMEDGRLE